MEQNRQESDAESSVDDVNELPSDIEVISCCSVCALCSSHSPLEEENNVEATNKNRATDMLDDPDVASCSTRREENQEENRTMENHEEECRGPSPQVLECRTGTKALSSKWLSDPGVASCCSRCEKEKKENKTTSALSLEGCEYFYPQLLECATDSSVVPSETVDDPPDPDDCPSPCPKKRRKSCARRKRKKSACKRKKRKTCRRKKPKCRPRKKTCPRKKRTCRRKKKRTCKRKKCSRPGPVQPNAYLNFLRWYRKRHCGLKPRDLIMKAARAWCRLDPKKRKRFERQACKVTKSCKHKRRKVCTGRD